MLSSKDYDLIMKWKRRGIPKEIIYRGINKAIENSKKKNGNQFPRSLAECAQSIEEEIRHYRSANESKSGTEPGKNGLIEKTAERLASIIASEKRKSVRGHYIDARNRVLKLMDSHEVKDELGGNRGNAFRLLERIEEDFYETFFQTLTENEKLKIEQMAQGMIDKKRERFMSKNARSESVLSFRNEILAKNYGLKNMFSDG